jgi:hypothetical protein
MSLFVEKRTIHGEIKILKMKMFFKKKSNISGKKTRD